MSPDAGTKPKSGFISSVLLTGLIAGTLDITAACIQYVIRTGNSPVRVLEFVASGVFGRDAFEGNAFMPAAGLFFHYFIATSWSFILFYLYPRVGMLRMNKYNTGVGYGILVWIVMNQFVLPLSRTPAIPFSISGAIQATLILIVCIGLPISIMTNRYYGSKTPSN